MSVEPLDWARNEIERLRAIVAELRPSERGSYATTERRRMETSAAIEMLRRMAPDSTFVEHSNFALKESYYDSQAIEAVARNLENWVGFVEKGLAGALPYEAQSRIDAATDLMQQVQALLDDSSVHPAAPVMLAGAALEEFLRSLLATTTASVSGTPSIAKYASSLRKAGLVSANDEKDILAIAGTRNDAAHGNFDVISSERARLMADQVNLFIRQKSPQ